MPKTFKDKDLERYRNENTKVGYNSTLEVDDTKEWEGVYPN